MRPPDSEESVKRLTVKTKRGASNNVMLEDCRDEEYSRLYRR